VPVSAQWFTHSDLDKSRQSQVSIQTIESKSESDVTVVDDIDTKSVKSDTTVIENVERTQTPAPVVPPRPVELKRAYSPPPVQRINENITPHTFIQPSNNSFHQKAVKPDLISEVNSGSAASPSQSNKSFNRLSTYENVPPPQICKNEPEQGEKTFLTEHTDMLSIQSTNSFCSTADRESFHTDITTLQKSNRASKEEDTLTFSSYGDLKQQTIEQALSEFESNVAKEVEQNNVSVNIAKEDKNVKESSSSSEDQSCIISVPQSPSLIRKKFQENSHIHKKFQKSADLELSHEFREGVKGKVSQSKQSFLAGNSSDKFLEAKEQRAAELQQIRLQRSGSKHNCDVEDTSDSRVDKFRQEKLRELQGVQRSRLESTSTEETISSRSYEDQKKAREQELATLAHRKIDLEDTAFFSPTELREYQLREEREKELAALCARSYIVDDTEIPEVTDEQLLERRDSLNQEANKNTVADVVPNSPKPSTVRRGSGLTLPAATIQDLTKELDALTDEAFEVLDFSRQKSNEPEIDRKSVRDTKAMWLHRETNRGSQDRSKSNTPTPSRRIGSMFKKDAEYWNIDDDFPAPPPNQDQYVQQQQQDDQLPPPPHHSDQSYTDVNPPPPPRQSSRGKVDEYRCWPASSKSAPTSGHQN